MSAGSEADRELALHISLRITDSSFHIKEDAVKEIAASILPDIAAHTQDAVAGMREESNERLLRCQEYTARIEALYTRLTAAEADAEAAKATCENLHAENLFLRKCLETEGKAELATALEAAKEREDGLRALVEEGVYIVRKFIEDEQAVPFEQIIISTQSPKLYQAVQRFVNAARKALAGEGGALVAAHGGTETP